MDSGVHSTEKQCFSRLFEAILTSVVNSEMDSGVDPTKKHYISQVFQHLNHEKQYFC